MAEKTAQEKAREQVNGWKAEKLQKDMEEQKAAESSLVALNDNKELMGMYNESAKMGSSNTPDSFPMLKLHVANKSRGNLLINGEEPNDGYFFHTKTKSQFKDPMVHILSISRSFYAKPQKDPKTGQIALDEKTGQPLKPKFTQLLSGVVTDGSDYQPFIMYFTGGKLNNLWGFAKLVQPLTNLKPVAIPMFALTVKLSREKVDSDYGPQSIVKFELVKDENGVPVLVKDPGEFTFLKDLLIQTESVLNSIIEHKEVGKTDSAGNEIEDVPFGDEPGDEIR
jgi:hypothetical protein